MVGKTKDARYKIDKEDATKRYKNLSPDERVSFETSPVVQLEEQMPLS